MQFIDIGVNLFSSQFAGNEKSIIEDSAAAGVGIIITGSSLLSSRQASDFIKSNTNAFAPGVAIYSTAGVHPHDAKECDDNTIDALRNIICNNSNVIAVGECGLDYDRMFSPDDVQRYWFERQIELAEELGKPLFLHEREASQDFGDIMARHPEVCKRAVVHCFTGTRAAAERYLELGCMIGITGWVCDKRRNEDLLDAMKVIPVERLMVETDAPYLKPRGIRGLAKGPNIPANVQHVAARIAELKNMEEDELASIVLANTKRFFGI